MERRDSGTVYLVGAGPGDPGLITRRGADLLSRADVVFYDRLVHPDVLKLAPDAQLVDVGKRPGDSAKGQERINQLLIDEAKAGKTVVRLKGGDPVVFGRGGEEMELLVANSVPFEIVPGVSSAIAGPAYAGIPLTHRDHASWVVLAAGHEHETKEHSSLDWEAFARAPTVVFLMGVARLSAICERLQAEGRSPDTPAAVVSWATWPQQLVVRSTIEKIANASEDAGVKQPAILIVGEVVRLSETLSWIERKPLRGKRVFVPRTRAQAGRLSGALRDLGAEPLEFPAIRITPPSSFNALDEAIAGLGEGWIAFTSTNAVDAFWDRLSSSGADARSLAGMRIAAVGALTAAALRAYGIVADLVPPTFTAESLVEAMGRGSGPVLIPRAEQAPDDLVDALERNGWSAACVPAYRTERDESSVDAGREAIDAGIDAVLFTSGSTARSFVELWGPPPEGCVVCCIGPRTAEAAASLGIRVDAVASEQSIEGLVNALVAAVRR